MVGPTMHLQPERLAVTPPDCAASKGVAQSDCATPVGPSPVVLAQWAAQPIEDPVQSSCAVRAAAQAAVSGRLLRRSVWPTARVPAAVRSARVCARHVIALGLRLRRSVCRMRWPVGSPPLTHSWACGGADHDPNHGLRIPIVTLVGGSWLVVGSGSTGFLEVSNIRSNLGVWPCPLASKPHRMRPLLRWRPVPAWRRCAVAQASHVWRSGRSSRPDPSPSRSPSPLPRPRSRPPPPPSRPPCAPCLPPTRGLCATVRRCLVAQQRGQPDDCAGAACAIHRAVRRTAQPGLRCAISTSVGDDGAQCAPRHRRVVGDSGCAIRRRISALLHGARGRRRCRLLVRGDRCARRGPARAEAPKSAYGVTVPDGGLSSAVGEFLAAYLTGAGEVDRYLAPGASLTRDRP
ncbi:hypothetical protein MBT84_47790 [Streptomyces sp. MBT84]|nr:hypothetical protein [Streptomyces sp. MBT84]